MYCDQCSEVIAFSFLKCTGRINRWISFKSISRNLNAMRSTRFLRIMFMDSATVSPRSLAYGRKITTCTFFVGYRNDVDPRRAAADVLRTSRHAIDETDASGVSAAPTPTAGHSAMNGKRVSGDRGKREIDRARRIACPFVGFAS